MGLLDRARTLDKEPSNNTTLRAELVDKALSVIDNSTGHVDYPGEVFEAFRSVIGFSKGALLLPDTATEEFYPWVSVGFDRTTTRRLRFSFDLVASESRNVVMETDMELLASMFSNREFGLIRKPLIIRLGDSNVPSALIITTDGPRGGSVDTTLIEALDTLNERLGDKITGSRSLMKSVDKQEASSVQEWFEGWGEKDAVLVILDASNAIDALINAIDGLELYRARKDAIGIIRRIIGRMGRLYDTKDGRILVLCPPERLSDGDLWLHQLSLAFSSAFGSLSEPPTFDASFFSWPTDKPVVEKALAGLL